MKKPREPSQIAECQNGSKGKLSEKISKLRRKIFRFQRLLKETCCRSDEIRVGRRRGKNETGGGVMSLSLSGRAVTGGLTVGSMFG
jgi:hypothetical protein